MLFVADVCVVGATVLKHTKQTLRVWRNSQLLLTVHVDHEDLDVGFEALSLGPVMDQDSGSRYKAFFDSVFHMLCTRYGGAPLRCLVRELSA